MNLDKLQYVTYSTILVALAITFLIMAKSILVPLLIALYIATALWPIHKKIKGLLKSNILSAAIIVLVLGTVFTIVILTFSLQANTLLEDFPNLTERMDQSVEVLKQKLQNKFNFNLKNK